MQIQIKAVFKRKPTLKTMKKITFLLLVLFLAAGCEKKQNTIVDPPLATYEFQTPVVPDAVAFTVNPVITPSIKVTNLGADSQVWFSIIYLNTGETISSKVSMLDDGSSSSSGDQQANDNNFTGKYTFTSTAKTGSYEVSFYVDTTIDGEESVIRVAAKTINFTGMPVNVPPVISDLSLPAAVDANTEFTISIKASDADGLSNLGSVWFKMTDPTGYTISTSVFLYDDGSTPNITDEFTGATKKSGDLTAGDGVFSRKLSFNSLAAKGDWTFTFQAKDNSNANSNTITQKLTLR